jgi:alkylation response protein AidB-like acyl-CoA dehydrogenase
MSESQSSDKAEYGPYADDPAAYRNAIRAWLATDAVDEWRHAEHRSDVLDDMQFTAGLMRALYASGFGRYGFTPAAGGLGGDVRHWAVMYDEIAAAGLPIPEQHALLNTMAASVMHFAPALGARFLPGCLRGDDWWGQGFSEPEAGSDLAALRCRAVRRGDTYVVSGQKLWTSHGEGATQLVCLVRTGTPESRHRGLTMIMIDAHAPGVTVRPIQLANGRAELAECFFDEVEVDADRLVGEENGGWGVAMHLLQFERGVYAWLRTSVLLGRLRHLAAELPASSAVSESAQRTIGAAYLDLAGLRARSAATVRRLAAGETVGPEGSADKVLLGNAEHSVVDAATELLGPAFALGNVPGVERWREEWWYSRTATIYGGSAEVQRGIIGDRVLLLPKA